MKYCAVQYCTICAVLHSLHSTIHFRNSHLLTFQPKMIQYSKVLYEDDDDEDDDDDDDDDDVFMLWVAFLFAGVVAMVWAACRAADI